VLVGGARVNVDVVYSYLIDFAWFFLSIWVLLLLTAGLVAFAEGPWMRFLPLMETMRRN
jgi:hypothetical protein